MENLPVYNKHWSKPDFIPESSNTTPLMGRRQSGLCTLGATRKIILEECVTIIHIWKKCKMIQSL